MPVSFYMDHHVPAAVTWGLRQRDVDVLTAFDDGASLLSDPDLLQRATELSRALFTQDEDLLIEASRLQRDGIPFAGVIYLHQQDTSIGRCVADLEIIAKVLSPEDLSNTVLYLPL